MFSDDRQKKYGYGTVRLILVILLSFMWNVPAPLPNFAKYFKSNRWIMHAYIGSIGALVNISVLGFLVNLFILIVAGVLCISDVLRFDYSIVIVLAKTFSGDFFAGKLDTLEWKLVLFFIFFALLPFSLYVENDLVVMLARFGKITGVLFCIQLFCEYGDNHFENYQFFRYRYSFEICNVLLILLLPLQDYERVIIQHDLVICLFYRLSNFCACYASNNSVISSTVFRYYLFKIHSFFIGIPVVNVTNPALASLVLKESNIKGHALERFIALPAWSPIISLESIDGPLWKQMSMNFHIILGYLPPANILSEKTKKISQKWIDSGCIISAECIAQMTVQVFIEYVFEIDWRPEFMLFVDASWEWRKEIAVRGPANKAIKRKTVQLVIKLLRESTKLWPIFGDLWEAPEYYSLILQPFIISPCINTGDIMVAMKRRPDLESLEACIRAFHPFPLLERFVDHDISVDGSKIDIQANTQVEIFLSDFANSDYNWPIFGCGDRICAGKHLAIPLLKVFHSKLSSLSQFQPQINHRYSGRNNDNNLTFLETAYFFRRIIQVLIESFAARRSS